MSKQAYNRTALEHFTLVRAAVRQAKQTRALADWLELVRCVYGLVLYAADGELPFTEAEALMFVERGVRVGK